MGKNENIEENFELWFLLNQTRDAVAKAREAELRDIGLTVPQIGLLYMVRNVEKIPTPANIARWLFRKQNTLFALLKGMEKRGLVKKVKDMEKKNLVRIVITEKGEEAYKQSREVNSVIEDIMSCLSKEEKIEFNRSLRKVRDKSFEKLGMEPISFP